MSVNLRSTSSEWKNMVEQWIKITEPSIPSPKEIDFQREYIKKHIDPNKEFKVLILGSTPRLRDLVSEFENCKVFLCDINPEMTFAMTELLERANHEDETWIKASWLDMPFKDEFFDIILGDITIDNLPFEFHNQYINEVSRVLKNDRAYLGRFIFFRDHHELANFEQIRNSYEKLQIKDLPALWSIGTFFRIPALTKEVKVKDFVNFITDKKSNFIKTSQEITGMKEYYSYNKSWFTYHIDDFKTLIKGKFNIKSSFVGDDNCMVAGYQDFLEILELRKV
jgi:ubiquinone/menaquinone biosynthesis C-methylase UbiE